jgi:plastocyanin
MLKRLPLALIASTAASLCLCTSAYAAPQTHMVVIDKMKFGPVPAQLHPGDTILWVNRDLFRHSATAANKSFDVDLPAGAQARMTIRASGTLAFACKYHPGMRGTLQVAAR